MVDLNALLAAEFGGLYDDLRAKLPSNPNGPNGDFSRRPLGGIDIAAIHHTVGSREGTWEAIARDHITSRRFAGIGYHIGIRLGRVAYLGDIGLGRACCEDQNHRVVCVSLTGNYDRLPVAPEDLQALERVLGVLQLWSHQTNGRRLQVLGHGDVPDQQTACPGANLKKHIPRLATIGPAAPAPTVDHGALVAAAKAAQVLRPNPRAALQKRLLADGFVPTSNEFRHGGHTAQLAERLSDGRVRIYLCPTGQWSAVSFIEP